MGERDGHEAAPEPGVAEVLELVRSAGGRVTAPRRALVEALFATDGHATAEDLVARVREAEPEAHLSTIYRNLEELEDLGVIAHSHLGHGAATYQLASRSHAHFLCSVCGRTTDAPPSLFAGVAAKVRDEIGFRIDASHFAVEGLCRACASNVDESP